MARRKSRLNRPVKKRVPKLETIFRCPFCQHESSVGCYFDKELNIGEIACSICQANFLTKLTPLTEAIDIYSEWIDECELVNKNRDHRYTKTEYDLDDGYIKTQC